MSDINNVEIDNVEQPMAGEAPISEVELGLVEEEIDLTQPTVNEVIQQQELKYPCLILQGVTTLQELEFLKNCKNNGETSLPLYISAFDQIKELGVMELTLDSMIRLNKLGGTDYKLYLCKKGNELKQIDFRDKTVLENLIRL